MCSGTSDGASERHHHSVYTTMLTSACIANISRHISLYERHLLMSRRICSDRRPGTLVFTCMATSLGKRFDGGMREGRPGRQRLPSSAPLIRPIKRCVILGTREARIRLRLVHLHRSTRGRTSHPTRKLRASQPDPPRPELHHQARPSTLRHPP